MGRWVLGVHTAGELPPFDGDEETGGQQELFQQILTGSFYPFDEDNGEENPVDVSGREGFYQAMLHR